MRVIARFAAVPTLVAALLVSPVAAAVVSAAPTEPRVEVSVGARSIAAAPTVRPLPKTGRFDYQLGGAYPPPAGVTIIARDVTDRPAAGTYGICYVNGFQTQPGQASVWRTKRLSALLKTATGRLATDPDWPDEFVLDPSTLGKRQHILAMIGPQIRECARRGFAAVEIDNLDTFTRFTSRTTGLVTRSGAMALAREYVAIAHGAGLVIAQKNTVELGSAGRRSIGFDFAVVEECFVYRECGSFISVYGARVLEIEYSDSLSRSSFAQVCGSRDRATRTILRDRDLRAAGRPGHLYRSC
ncbi:endo alpha-1,4 polygalactosaminidase [Nakamurella sp. A5-74]|uniref:Endo alpha-1,4 polygalactosaminidase n=1 Tax=Nakamurella sp. A5-74 TaxID=3158264 RepID=A0AAU8DP30_9ACTN